MKWPVRRFRTKLRVQSPCDAPGGELTRESPSQRRGRPPRLPWRWPTTGGLALPEQPAAAGSCSLKADHVCAPRRPLCISARAILATAGPMSTPVVAAQCLEVGVSLPLQFTRVYASRRPAPAKERQPIGSVVGARGVQRAEAVSFSA